ncbi:hypothetical protein CA260_09835 [Dyella jiangningensis]|uniref:eCIS core domain-containing protein n=1 Tax=Dyella jiangningensis TaxID=1379159 RepID=A0A328PA29_9GAMM|nr:hypothetical protein CA260_09835 [Dyella jiangningensis]
MQKQTARHLMHVAPPSSGHVLQRKCACGNHAPGGGECEQCKKRVQRKGEGAAGPTLAPGIVSDVLAGTGRPLDGATRGRMEQRFSHDFSGVRIHSDSQAARSAQAVGALAYTVGQHIVFGEGRFAPQSGAGQRLLAHELTHTIQQRTAPASLNPRLSVGASDTAEEVEADRVADHVMSGRKIPAIGAGAIPLLRRQTLPDGGGDADAKSEPDFSQPQKRGAQGRAASVDAGKRGDDEVKIRIIRYLCACRGRNVTRTSASAQLQPNPGVTLEICNGQVTARVTGDIVPSTATTGTAKVGVDVNVAGKANVGVQGQIQNTGNEPQVGPSADVRVKLPNGGQIGASGGALRGTQSGKWSGQGGIGYQTPGGTTVGGQVSAQQGGPVVVTGGLNIPLGGQNVSNKTCRECYCPLSYQCYADVVPRDYDTPTTYDVEQRGRLRYYFSLDKADDTTDPTLKGESTRTLDEVAKQVAAGSKVRSITGYASPEDNREKPEPNQKLSMDRAKRLHDLLGARLGASASLPSPAAGGELLGRAPTIAPGSSLAQAMLDAGFGDPEDVTQFLVGSDIPNPKLADQFLGLLDRVTEPADRLKLFGVGADSPAAPKLLAAIELFRKNRGRGRRPWEGIFGFLRYATVELSTTHKEAGTEHHRTTGSLTPMAEAVCKPYAIKAEATNSFGPAEREPDKNVDCPSEPANLPETDKQCHYD